MDALGKSMSETLKKAASATLMLLIAAGVTLPLPAQQKAPAAKAPTAPIVAQEEEESTEAPKKPGQEGIKVHGHWVMELKDKDGHVIDRRDFQNSLETYGGSGSDLLSSLLLGSFVPSNLAISAQNFVPNYSSGTPNQNGITYLLFPPSTQDAACNTNTDNFNNVTYCAPGMTQKPTYTLVNGQRSGTSVVLQGQFVAAAPVTVLYVATHAIGCQENANPASLVTVAPSKCPTQDPNFNFGEYLISTKNFTRTTLQNPLPVANGQTLMITVTLSFS